MKYILICLGSFIAGMLIMWIICKPINDTEYTYNETNSGIKIDYITNSISLTNHFTNISKMVVSNIITIFEDYDKYSTEPFIFNQTNELLNVSLYKRSADYIIKNWNKDKKWIIGAMYPLGFSIKYNIIDIYGIDLYIGTGYCNSNLMFSIDITL